MSSRKIRGREIRRLVSLELRRQMHLPFETPARHSCVPAGKRDAKFWLLSDDLEDAGDRVAETKTRT